MKYQNLILSLLTVTALVMACKPSEEQSTQRQLDKVTQETKTAAQDMKDYTYAQKSQFVETMQGQLTALNADLDKLAAKLEKSGDEVRSAAKPKLQGLRDQTAGLNKQLDEVRNATESTWDSAQNGFKKAYASSMGGFQQARQWVSDKIAP
jgi:chromosome segregation ATPase